MGQCLGRLQSARPRLRARFVPTARTAWQQASSSSQWAGEPSGSRGAKFSRREGFNGTRRDVDFEEEEDSAEGVYYSEPDSSCDEEDDAESGASGAGSDASSVEGYATGVGSGGSSSAADAVYRDLLRRGAVPAIVGKRKHGEEVEMELFTPESAKKARLIPQERHGQRRRPGGGVFESFFQGF